jgi:hypothetical protein
MNGYILMIYLNKINKKIKIGRIFLFKVKNKQEIVKKLMNNKYFINIK